MFIYSTTLIFLSMVSPILCSIHTSDFLNKGTANFQTRSGVTRLQPGTVQVVGNTNQNELDEIKSTTQTVVQEMASMRKFIEDMHISVNEKDAEIIKLKMHLGDERNKVA